MSLYKRSVFLINPKFQLRFSLIVCFIVLISTIIYPIIIYDFFELVTQNSETLPDIVISAKNDLIFFLVIIQLIVTVLIFIIFIFLTHKVAGPLYKLKNHLKNISEGAPITSLKFRKGDYFQELADEVTIFLENISYKQEEDFEYLEEISQYIENLTFVVPDDKKPVLTEISRKLNQILTRYK